MFFSIIFKWSRMHKLCKTQCIYPNSIYQYCGNRSDSILPANKVALCVSACFLILEKFWYGFILSSRKLKLSEYLFSLCFYYYYVIFLDWWHRSVSLTGDWRVDNCRLSWPQWVRRRRETKSNILKEPSASLIKENWQTDLEYIAVCLHV